MKEPVCRGGKGHLPEAASFYPDLSSARTETDPVALWANRLNNNRSVRAVTPDVYSKESVISTVRSECIAVFPDEIK